MGHFAVKSFLDYYRGSEKIIFKEGDIEIAEKDRVELLSERHPLLYRDVSAFEISEDKRIILYVKPEK